MLRSQSIILVGNGPSLLDREIGTQIDKFDKVVRFNNFVTQRFEKHVGSKTNYWCRNEIDHTAPRTEKIEKIFVRLKGEDRTEYYNGLSFVPRNLQEEFPNSDIEVIPLYIYENLIKEYKFEKNPLTGTVLIHYLLQSIDNIHVCGFDNLNGEWNEPRHYYSVNNLHAGAIDWHETSKEINYLKSQINDKRITLL